MNHLPISFEFFPPKTKEGEATLQQTVTALSALKPDFYSVTFGAGGSTRSGTIDTVKMLQTMTTTTIVPHLSCVGYDRNEIIEILKIYQAMGIKRLVALRGDLPSGMGQSGELRFASDLVSLIREETADHFHITVAAYPETHPRAKCANSDILSLKNKFEAGANLAITQYFFNADAYFYFIEECAKQQIFIPIVPGIMPILQFNRLASFSDRCGAEIPQWLRRRLESYGDDAESIQKFGLEVVQRLCEQLIAGGAPGFHFYTLNQAEIPMEILRSLGITAAATTQTNKNFIST